MPHSSGAPRGKSHILLLGGIGAGWIVTRRHNARALGFDSLAAALAFAQSDCAAGEAVIEIQFGGLYVVVHQPAGWPNRICVAATGCAA